MLVLTRRAGESLVIGNDVVVTVLEVRGDQVRLGINAPRHIQVHREEVYRQVERENSAAVASATRASALLGRQRPELSRRQSGSDPSPAAAPDVAPDVESDGN